MRLIAWASQQRICLEIGATEVEHFNAITSEPVRFEPDIVRLEIAMNDALLVRFMNRGTHLIENVGNPLERESLLLRQHIAERAAIEVLHHEVCDLAGLHTRETKIRYVNDVRVA